MPSRVCIYNRKYKTPADTYGLENNLGNVTL